MGFGNTIAAALRVASRLQGVAVVYRRGGDEVELPKAVPGQTTTEQLTGDGSATVRGHIRDYLIMAEDLVLAGERITPKEGDQILETVGGKTHVYDVRPVSDGKCWRWSDPHHNRIRVHTRHMATD